MRSFLTTGFMLCLLVLAAPSVMAAESTHGSRDEAKAMAEKAAALVKEDPKKAFAKFQEKDGGFFDRDLYVFVNDSKGVFVAHGAKPVLVGKEAISMKDSNGFEFIKAFLEVKDAGWVDYRWPDPLDNNKIKDKSSYIIKVGEYAVGVGYYKN